MSDELEPLSPALRALLDRERSAPVPATTGAQDRLLGLLAAAGGAAPTPPSPEASDAPVPPGAGGATPAVWSVGKSLVVAATTGALGFAGGLAVPRTPEPAPTVEPPAPAPVVAPAPLPEVTPLPPELAVDAGQPAAPKPTKKRPLPEAAPAPEVAPPPAPAGSPATTSDIEHVSERQLIDAARVALGRGRAHDALLFLMGHARRFADGNFVEERELLMIEAFAAQGRGEQAKARARAFLERFPQSPHAERVRAVAGR